MYPVTMIHRNMSEGVFMNEINQFFFTFLNSLGLKYKKAPSVFMRLHKKADNHLSRTLPGKQSRALHCYTLTC